MFMSFRTESRCLSLANNRVKLTPIGSKTQHPESIGNSIFFSVHSSNTPLSARDQITKAVAGIGIEPAFPEYRTKSQTTRLRLPI